MREKAGILQWGHARWRYYLLLTGIALLVLTFGSNIIRYGQGILGDMALLRFKSTLSHDVLFGISGVLAAAAFVVKKVHLSLPLRLLLLLGLCFYIIARYTSDAHVFTRYLKAPFLAYADSGIPLLLALLAGSISWRRTQRHLERSGKAVFTDAPIQNKEADTFGFISIVTDVASFIKSYKPRTTRTIGVHGTWGAGKTSFINLVRENLRDDRIRFVDFTPWQSSDEPFVSQLLSRLIEAIEPKEQELREELESYSELLADISIVGSFFERFSAPRDSDPAKMKELRESINSRLSSSGYTYVVVVDDLDRLTGKEVLDVLKLVRSSVDFNGLYYLLAYDRIEVNRCLEAEGIKNSKYFDKFVELEIGLPHVTPRRLGDFLVEHIDLGADESAKTDLKNSLFGAMGERFDYGAFISTPRDAKRLALSTNVFYHRVQKDVTLHDAVLVQMLRMRFPDVLELFARDFRRFLDHQNNHAMRKPLVLKKAGSEAAIEIALAAEVQANRISKADMEDFLRILRRLFPEQHWTYGENYNSVCYTDSFYRYFTYYVDSSTILENDFRDIISGNEPADVVAKRVIEKNQELSLCLRFENGSSRENRWRVVEILFALARADRPANARWNMRIGDATHWLKTQLMLHKFEVNDQVPSSDRERFIAVLEKGDYPYGFERNLLNSLYSYGGGNNFIIGREDIKQRILDYIDRIIDQNDGWNKEVADALGDCSVDEWEPIGPNSLRQVHTYLKEGVAVFDKARIKYGTKAFCMWFLAKNNDPDWPEYYAIRKAAKDQYGSWEAFRAYLISVMPQDDFTTELLQLWGLLAEKNFEKYVEFTPIHLVE